MVINSLTKGCVVLLFILMHQLKCFLKKNFKKKTDIKHYSKFSK